VIASLATWLIASAAGSALGRGFFEVGIAPYWGALLAAAQGLVLRRRGVPLLRWVMWSTGGWVAGALIGTRLISAIVRAMVAVAPGANGVPPDLVPAVTVFTILGAAEFVVLRPHMPSAVAWVSLNAIAGADTALLESPIRMLIFAPVEAAGGTSAAEAAVGGALGVIYAAITAPQMLRIRPATRAQGIRHDHERVAMS
jgi:hypothetical protein